MTAVRSSTTEETFKKQTHLSFPTSYMEWDCLDAASPKKAWKYVKGMTAHKDKLNVFLRARKPDSMIEWEIKARCNQPNSSVTITSYWWCR